MNYDEYIMENKNNFLLIKAINVYTEAIRIKPSDADSYLNRGKAYAKLKNHKKAIDDFTSAVYYGSDELKKKMLLFYLRGQEYTELGDYKNAINDFSESLRLNPDHNYSLLMRGNAYLGAGEKDKAKADFDEYLKRKRKLAYDAGRNEIMKNIGVMPEDI